MAPRIRRSLNKPKIKCGQCELEVEKEDDDIQCDKCKKIFHAICTSLNKRQYEYLLKNESEEYVCHLCYESEGSIRKELNDITTKLNKLSKLDQLDAMQETMQFMSNQFDDMLKSIADNAKKLEAVQKENKLLKNEIEDLKSCIKFLNDNRVKNDCIINGLDVKNDASAVETVLNMMKDVGVDLQANDIDDAYFLKNPRNESKDKKVSMVVKFVNKKSKQTVMASKTKLKVNKTTESVFINDYLSRESLNLLKYAKTLKTVGYRRVYPMGGRIYTRRSDLSKPKVIKNANEVDALLLEATVNRRPCGNTDLQSSSDSEDEPNTSYLSPS